MSAGDRQAYEAAVRRAPTSQMTREQYLQAAEERGRRLLQRSTTPGFLTAPNCPNNTATGPLKSSS